MASYMDDPGILARAAIMMRVQRDSREIKKLAKELEHWKAEADANERKKAMCMALLVVALGDDVIDVFGALVSFGLIQSITFPIPGIIRMLVSSTEREQKPDRLIRAIGAMAIEAIPWINLLPTTTINLIIDFIEAYYDSESAKNNVEKREKKIKSLQANIKQSGVALRNVPQAA